MDEREIMVTFGRNLQHLMTKKEVSFRELSNFTGINPGSLNEYALAKRNVSLKYANAIAKHFGTTVDDMLKPMEGSHVYQVKDKRIDKRKAL